MGKHPGTPQILFFTDPEVPSLPFKHFLSSPLPSLVTINSIIFYQESPSAPPNKNQFNPVFHFFIPELIPRLCFTELSKLHWLEAAKEGS